VNVPPRLDLFDDKNTLEADPERAFFVEARLVRGDVHESQVGIAHSQAYFSEFPQVER
jgi:hypothetical protein